MEEITMNKKTQQLLQVWPLVAFDVAVEPGSLWQHPGSDIRSKLSDAGFELSGSKTKDDVLGDLERYSMQLVQDEQHAGARAYLSQMRREFAGLHGFDPYSAQLDRGYFASSARKIVREYLLEEMKL